MLFEPIKCTPFISVSTEGFVDRQLVEEKTCSGNYPKSHPEKLSKYFNSNFRVCIRILVATECVGGWRSSWVRCGGRAHEQKVEMELQFKNAGLNQSNGVNSHFDSESNPAVFTEFLLCWGNVQPSLKTLPKVFNSSCASLHYLPYFFIP